MRRIHGILRIAILPASVSPLALSATVALAQQAPLRAFDIKAQPLSSALLEFSRQSDVMVVVAPELTDGKRSPALKGTMSASEAIARLLGGSRLRAMPNPKGGYVIEAEASAEGNAPAAGEAANGGDKERTSGTSEIVVTGTRIRGAKPVGAPLRIIGRHEIDASGYTTTQQLLQALPQNFRGGAAGATADANLSSGAVSGYNTNYGSGVNLRGLGSTATLVLLNGHRVASSGSGYFTDISTVPLSAIDHVEVLTDGASAVYGSDAVAGVVNIVLRDDYQGLLTGFRFGDATAGGLASDGATLTFGQRWGDGGFIVGADLSHSSNLDVADRHFTASVPSPTSIFPKVDQQAYVIAAHQDLGEHLQLFGDAQYTRDSKLAYTASFRAPGTALQQDLPSQHWRYSLGGRYRAGANWEIEYSYTNGRSLEQYTDWNFTGGRRTSLYGNGRLVEEFHEHDLSANGSLFRLPAGHVKIAIGASDRAEEFRRATSNPGSATFRYVDGRRIHSAFAELLIPIFDSSNSIPAFRQLSVSAAVRHDHYSDFGGTTNPKFGVSWSPVLGLGFRGTYGTSFRAPAVGNELQAGEQGTQAIAAYNFISPDGTRHIPVIYLIGGKPNLKPETAKNLTTGFDYSLPFIPGLRLSATYYSISYTNQLATPPFSFAMLTNPAFATIMRSFSSPAELRDYVNSLTATGATYFNFYSLTGGPAGVDPLSTATVLIDGRLQNVSQTKTDGVDFEVTYVSKLGQGHLNSRLDASYIDKFESKLTPAAAPISLIDTVGYPTRWRVRALEDWLDGPIDLSMAINFVNGYPDTSAAPSVGRVRPFTTVDLVGRYDFSGMHFPGASGMVASLALTNIFDAPPPYVTSGTAHIPGSHYDAANADPRGRFIELTIQKRW